MDILNKEMNFKMLMGGEFGNRIRMWNSYKELLMSGFDGKVTMRYKGSVGASGSSKYGVPISKVKDVIVDWKRSGLNSDKIVFNEDCPDQYLTLQGEFLKGDIVTYKRDENDSYNRPVMVELFYSTLPTKMRIALKKEGKRVYGIEARIILKDYLDSISLDCLYNLSEKFNNHVIEFSTYKMPIGNIPNRNTIIWEVRKY